MHARGIDLSAHRAHQLTSELVAWADQIWTMTAQRRSQILDQVSDALTKTTTFSPEIDLNDPIGGTHEEYSVLADIIEKVLKDRLQSIP